MFLEFEQNYFQEFGKHISTPLSKLNFTCPDETVEELLGFKSFDLPLAAGLDDVELLLALEGAADGARAFPPLAAPAAAPAAGADLAGVAGIDAGSRK